MCITCAKFSRYEISAKMSVKSLAVNPVKMFNISRCKICVYRNSGKYGTIFTPEIALKFMTYGHHGKLQACGTRSYTYGPRYMEAFSYQQTVCAKMCYIRPRAGLLGPFIFSLVTGSFNFGPLGGRYDEVLLYFKIFSSRREFN